MFSYSPVPMISVEEFFHDDPKIISCPSCFATGRELTWSERLTFLRKKREQEINKRNWKEKGRKRLRSSGKLIY
jgi:hypothetical protein